MENSRNHQPPTSDSAAEDLAFLRTDGARAAASAAAPLWYHILQSACVAGFLLAFSLPTSWFITVICAAAVLYTVLGFLRPRLTHVQASPWERSASRRIGLQLLATLICLGVAGVWLYTISGQLWILIASATLALVLTLVMSQRMEKAFITSYNGTR
ncbi:UNVERIFIED_CONTAM: hypothetical protein ABIE34_002973 [Jeotgalibacillus campisalis]